MSSQQKAPTISVSRIDSKRENQKAVEFDNDCIQSCNSFAAVPVYYKHKASKVMESNIATMSFQNKCNSY